LLFHFQLFPTLFMKNLAAATADAAEDAAADAAADINISNQK
jgi:hypothetical protein